MSNEVAKSVRDRLTGILPPITMPFDASGGIVTSGIAEQVEFMISAGARGIVAGGSTGEGHTLSTEEFVIAMRAVHNAIRGRVPFLVGLIVNSTREAIDRVRRLDGLDIAALQVTPVHYLFKPEADATIAHFRAIWDAAHKPILIYNVIPWNYLSADLMLRVMDEVPGVVGMKQSSGDLKSVSDLLMRARPENLVLTGIDALLYPAFALGAHGAITALTSSVPEVTVKLFDAVAADDHAGARTIHFALNRLWNALRHDNLPACAKYIQHRQGLEFYHPRAPMEPVGADQKRAIDAALEPLLDLIPKRNAA